MVKLSVVIPDYKDPLLIKTIDSLLENSELGADLEIIAVIDGYEPFFELRQDPRVKYIKLGRNRGMRGAINAGVDIAKGDFLMRTDEHCIFGKGYDRILTETCEPNWIVTLPQYCLDPIKWERMDIEPVYHQKLVIQEGKKFSGVRWRERDEQQKDVPISETLGMQGSMWMMPHEWWNKVIVELDTEHYGPLIQDSTEMTFKTWQAGGKLMLNKNSWYAHKHRDFPRTHNNGTAENPADNERGYKYALDIWKDYYDKEVVPKWFPS